MIYPHHLQAWATLTAMSVPPRPPFLLCRIVVNRYHPGNLYRYCYALPYILAISYNARKKFLGHSRPRGGGGGGGGGGEWVKTYCMLCPKFKNSTL